MLIIITSIIISLTVLLSAFVSFFPNLNAVLGGDFRRRVYSNTDLYALQYGQIALRAKTLREDDSFTFSPRQDCAGGCPVPAPQNGEYLTAGNAAEKTSVYSVISYRKLSGTDPSPTLQVVSSIRNN